MQIILVLKIPFYKLKSQYQFDKKISTLKSYKFKVMENLYSLQNKNDILT